MSSIYESSYNINSYYAVNAATGQQIPADDLGYINLNVGDTVMFEASDSKERVYTNTLVFAGADTAMKVYVNNNTKYPIYIPAGSNAGVQYVRVYSFTALTAGKLYYDGLVS